LTRWIAGASIVVAGVFSAVAAKAVPGKSSSAGQQPTQQPSQPDTTTSPSVTDSGNSQGNGGLVPPALPPAPARGSGSVSSGAS
jgi:hypothetical protein